MAQTTYQVVLSTDGKHSVIVTTDNQGETKLGLAWAKATYEHLVAQYGLKGKQRQAPSEPEAGDNQPGEAPICAVHNVPMAWQQGKKGFFWSCHEKNADGSWCSYKPNDREE